MERRWEDENEKEGEEEYGEKGKYEDEKGRRNMERMGEVEDEKGRRNMERWRKRKTRR